MKFNGKHITQSKLQQLSNNKDAVFNDPIVYENCVFDNEVHFEYCHAYRRISFYNCVFKRNLVFGDLNGEYPAIVDQDLCFSNCEFSSKVLMEGLQ